MLIKRTLWAAPLLMGALGWLASAPAEAASGVVNDGTQITSSFEAGSVAPYSVCTTQAPNRGVAVNDIPGETGAYSMRFDWAQSAYNGTRMTRGAEACSTLQTYKSGWFGFSLYLPSQGYPTDTEAAIAQVFQKGACNSWAAMLIVVDNDLYVQHRHYCGTPVRQRVATNIPRDTWVPVILHFVASHSGAGKFQVWFNGAPMNEPTYDASGINFGFTASGWTADDSLPSDSPLTFKFGQYNYTTNEYVPGETRTSYYDNVTQINADVPNAWTLADPRSP